MNKTYCGESNKKAVNNGLAIEKQISGMLHTRLTGDLIDLYLQGIPYEIKSCQERIKGRSGRFWLRPDQHNTLLELGGYYIFVVHNNLVMKKIKIVPAWRVAERLSRSVTKCWRAVL